MSGQRLTAQELAAIQVCNDYYNVGFANVAPDMTHLINKLLGHIAAQDAEITGLEKLSDDQRVEIHGLRNTLETVQQNALDLADKHDATVRHFRSETET